MVQSSVLFGDSQEFVGKRFNRCPIALTTTFAVINSVRVAKNIFKSWCVVHTFICSAFGPGAIQRNALLRHNYCYTNMWALLPYYQ